MDFNTCNCPLSNLTRLDFCPVELFFCPIELFLHFVKLCLIDLDPVRPLIIPSNNLTCSLLALGLTHVSFRMCPIVDC